MPPTSKFHPLWPRITQIFFLTAALESLIVYTAVNWFDRISLIKNGDSNSAESFLLRPIVSTIILWAFCVIADNAIRARLPQMARSLDFNAFSKEVFKSWHGIPWFALVLAYALGVNRLFPIASHTVYLFIGISPIELLTQLIGNFIKISPDNARIAIYVVIFSVTANYFHRQLYRRLGGV